MNIIQRPRRLRRSPAIRRLVRETRVAADSLVLPFFVREGTGIREPLASLPGQIRYSPDTLGEGIEKAREAGVNAFILFGIPAEKDDLGSGAWDENGVVQQALRNVRRSFPDSLLVTDVCLCEYTAHGHCGVPDNGGDGGVDNDKTLALLAKTALSHIEAGADIVAPSDMMDGRVAAIRSVLDENGFANTAVMSYAVKYASAFYGPFREAAGSAPGFGDRKGYQMDWHNVREARRETELDLAEGADFVIVKPALCYLDVIARVADIADRPVAAYHVSGEYAMLHAAADRGLLDLHAAMCETAGAIYRAGADILITYFAAQLAEAIRKGDLG